MKVYYRVELTIEGGLLNESAYTKAFAEDDRINSPRCNIRGGPVIRRKERSVETTNFELKALGEIEPGSGQLFFQSDQEFGDTEALNIVDNALGKIGVPVRVEYIDVRKGAKFNDWPANSGSTG